MRVIDRAAFIAIERDSALELAVIGVEAFLRDQQRIGAHALLGHKGRHARRNQRGNASAHADIDHQLGCRAVAGDAQNFVPDGLVGIVLGGNSVYAFCAQRLGEQGFAQLTRLGLRCVLEERANLGACATGFDKAKPGRVGRGGLSRDDLYHIAAFEFGAQWHFFVIDLGSGGAVADLAVNGVGKVHHGGAARHGHDLALGREHIDSVGEEVHFDMVPELGRITGFVLNVQQ